MIGDVVRTQISLTREQHDAMTLLAQQRGVSMSAVIRDAIDRLVVLSQQSAAELLLEIVDANVADAVDGPSDLARNHDAYLYGDDEGRA